MPLLFGNEDFFGEQILRHSAGQSNSYVHVLLHSTNGDDTQDKRAVECREPFHLADRLWICRLPDNLRDVVYQSCEPPGVPYQKPFRQYGQLYTIAFFSGPWMPGQLSQWDAHGEITQFVSFSQLVHPTSIGFGNSARLTFAPNGHLLNADPGPCRGITEQAFTIPPHRNWISKSECEQVKNLIANSNLNELPDKVTRANWNVQHAAYQYFLEVRAMLIVSGLEALLHTRGTKRGGPGTGEQFVGRTARLARLLAIPYTRNEAKAVWDHRSDVVHGRDPWASRREARENLKQPPDLRKDNETVRPYLRAEELLRAAVLRCLTNRQFAAKFASDHSVENSFPL